MGNIVSTLVSFVQSQPYLALFAALAVVYGVRKNSPTAVGACIEVLYPGKTGSGKEYLKAKLLAYGSNGTAKVQYFDGDVEDAVPLKRIHFAHGRLSVGARKKLMGLLGFMVGDSIEGNYGGKGKWYPGAIAGKNADGTFKLRYNDSDVETSVKQEYIRFREVMPIGAVAKKEWAPGKGQAHLDTLDEKALTKYFIECSNAGVRDDMVLMLADDVKAKLKEHNVEGKEKCTVAVEKVIEKTKGYLRLTGEETVDVLEEGPPLQLQMKYKAIFGIGVQVTLHWQNRKIVFFTIGRS